ncbi:MAG TPA: MbnP family protein [Cyclobacteriaceae bacterium]
MKATVRNQIFFMTLLSAILIMMVACNKDDAPTPEPGKMTLQFIHLVNGDPVVYDQMNYTNAAGNEYEVTEVQWFISDLTIHKNDGTSWMLGGEDFAHYIDSNLPETFIWELHDEIASGDYSSISMTFGLKGEKNIPYFFTDPPESDMLWPIHMGGENGGYHYMKLNGFWKNESEERVAFNFHLGVGHEIDNEGNKTFFQNWFEINLNNSSFKVKGGETINVLMKMNIDQWFENPNSYDHDVYGAQIMHNQEAMSSACMNGQFGVFEISSINKDDAL